MTSDLQLLLASLPKRAPRKGKPKPVTITAEAKIRYQQAHEQDFRNNYPQAYASGNYFKPVMPKTNTANGLTQAIVKFLLYSGHRATRIASSGRIVKSPERQASGTVLQTAKYIPGSTRRGTADISATVHGRSVMIEVKINDQPSKEQLREQELEQRAGGQYWFVHNFDEFLELYDEFVLSLNRS